MTNGSALLPSDRIIASVSISAQAFDPQGSLVGPPRAFQARLGETCRWGVPKKRGGGEDPRVRRMPWPTKDFPGIDPRTVSDALLTISVEAETVLVVVKTDPPAFTPLVNDGRLAEDGPGWGKSRVDFRREASAIVELVHRQSGSTFIVSVSADKTVPKLPSVRMGGTKPTVAAQDEAVAMIRKEWWNEGSPYWRPLVEEAAGYAVLYPDLLSNADRKNAVRRALERRFPGPPRIRDRRLAAAKSLYGVASLTRLRASLRITGLDIYYLAKRQGSALSPEYSTRAAGTIHEATVNEDEFLAFVVALAKSGVIDVGSLPIDDPRFVLPEEAQE